MIINGKDYPYYNQITVKMNDVAVLRPVDFRGRARGSVMLGIAPAQEWPVVPTIYDWKRQRKYLSKALYLCTAVIVLTEPMFHTEVEVLLSTGEIGCIDPRKLVRCNHE